MLNPVSWIQHVSPETKFVGSALAEADGNPKYYEYFLDPKNHRPGIPLDLSHSTYASPAMDEDHHCTPGYRLGRRYAR